MSVFFDFLPTDLQIDILHVWLNADDCGSTLLRVLSALDVSCSTQRSSLLHLIGQLPPFGEYSTRSSEFSAAIRLPVSYLQWLASRSVPVRTVVLAGDRVQGLGALNLTLPLVQTLRWQETSVATAVDLASVLRCLPNLTAIHQLQGPEVDASLTPQLKVLANFWSQCRDILPIIGPCRQLLELRITRFQLTSDLTDRLIGHGFVNLQVLEVSLEAMVINNLMRLLQAYPTIVEVALHAVEASKVVEVAEAFPNIRRFTVSVQRWFADLPVFIDMLTRCPHLEYVKVAEFTFIRKDGILCLAPGQQAAGEISTTDLSKILTHCCPLKEFTWKAMIFDVAMVDLLVDKIGSLRSLTINPNNTMLNSMLQQCGGTLKYLTLAYAYKGSPSPLRIIAITCPELVSLSVRVPVSSKLEGGFSALFTGCSKLKELTVEAYFQTVDLHEMLGTIIHSKVRLRLLKLVGVQPNEPAVAWFRQHVREQQLLPVPVIVIIDKC